MSQARLLLVSHNFPPHQTAGALRWQKFALALAERGTLLDVLIGAVGESPHGLEAPDGVPSGTRVFTVADQPSRLAAIEDAAVDAVRGLRRGGTSETRPDGEPAARPPAPAPGSIAADSMSWVPRSVREVRRAYWVLAQQESDQRWARAAEAVGRRLLRETRYGAVITSGPPHSAHIAGRRIAGAASLPLILDFRDPWSLPRRVPESYAHPLYFMLAGRLERSVVEAASAVVTNTPAVLEAMRSLYPDHAGIVCIPNGYDEVFDLPARRVEFSIVYAGAIYLDRDPRPLFAALTLLESDPAVDLSGVYLDLIGKVDSYDGVPTSQLIAEAGISRRVRLHPAVPREELYRRLRQASVLVSLPQDSPWAIPSKVYEYMGFPASLMAFAAEGSPVAHMLVGTRADIIRPGDVENTASTLKRHLERFRAGQQPIRPVADDQFSRSAQSMKLTELLDGLGV